jgi:rare lipoprotein A
MMAAALGACMQTPAVTDKSELRASRQASPGENQEAPVKVTRRRVAIKAIKHTPYKHTAATPATSYGVASFYTEEQQTANGEKFNPAELTAAHPTLPFGTRLRVTNVSTGRSVTVRINDRGPYVPGRVVDVSYSAAETLGIVDRGVAKVKLDVIH